MPRNRNVSTTYLYTNSVYAQNESKSHECGNEGGAERMSEGKGKRKNECVCVSVCVSVCVTQK